MSLFDDSVDITVVDATGDKNELEQHSLNLDDYDYEGDYAYRDNYDYSYDYLERPPENVNCSLFEGPKKVTADLENKKCTEFNEEGYRCVPFYACKGGEIITNGAGLANVRGAGMEVAVFNPLDSKCEESLDMCCRHPDWKDVPLEEEIELPPAIPVECLDEFQNL
jgi:hypothetical protein